MAVFKGEDRRRQHLRWNLSTLYPASDSFAVLRHTSSDTLTVPIIRPRYYLQTPNAAGPNNDHTPVLIKLGVSVQSREAEPLAPSQTAMLTQILYDFLRNYKIS